MKMKVFLLLAIVLLVCGGCVTQTMSERAKVLKAADKLFVTTVDFATALRASGSLSEQDDAKINVIIHRVKTCLNDEAAFLQDPNARGTYDGLICATTGISEILELVKGKAK